VNRRRTTPLVGLLVAATCLVLGVQGAAADEAGGCEDLLVAHAPAGSRGDTDAVAITSQSLERGVAGWASVGWSAAPGTEVRAVEIVTEDGVEVVAGAPEGVAGPASELRFCGRRAATAATVTSDDADGTSVAAERPAGSSLPLGVLGATTGLVVGGVVLLLGHAARNQSEVTV
jgi:hypothetical protein